ncbi:unnamed protein product [Ectocarpus sp. 12 AP-2014]
MWCRARLFSLFSHREYEEEPMRDKNKSGPGYLSSGVVSFEQDKNGRVSIVRLSISPLFLSDSSGHPFPASSYSSSPLPAHRRVFRCPSMTADALSCLVVLLATGTHRMPDVCLYSLEFASFGACVFEPLWR